MEWAGARGALVAGGLLIAGSIGAGLLLRRRTAPVPLTLPTKDGDVTGREALSTAA